MIAVLMEAVTDTTSSIYQELSIHLKIWGI